MFIPVLFSFDIHDTTATTAESTLQLLLFLSILTKITGPKQQSLSKLVG